MASSKQSRKQGIPILMSCALSFDVGATSLRILASSHEEVRREIISYKLLE